jgi:hypothetical protein
MEKSHFKTAVGTVLAATSAACILLATGCYSLETAPLPSDAGSHIRLHAAPGESAEHIVVANDGWYLFNIWPLASGNPDMGAWFPISLFKNCVHEDVLQDRLTRYAKKLGYMVSDLVLISNEQVFLSIPGTELPVPIPYLLTYRRKQFSAVLVKPAAGRPPEPTDPDAARRQRLSREMKNLLNEIPDGDAK